MQNSSLCYLFVIPWSPSEIGGVSVAVSNLARELGSRPNAKSVVLDSSYGCDSVTQTGRGRNSDQFRLTLRLPQEPLTRVGAWLSFLARLPFTAYRLAAFCRRQNISVLNFHYPSLATLNGVAALSMMSSAKLVLSFHGLDLRHAAEQRGIAKWFWHRIIRRADSIVVCSRDMAARVESTWPFASDKTCVIHNGIDERHTRSAFHRGRIPPGLETRDLILNVGTLEHKKGQDLLIRAFAQISERFPAANLVIMGRKGDYYAELREFVQSSKAADRITILLDVPHADTMATMKASRMFVLPSRDEPFGIVLLEAGLAEIPVIASRVGGITEIIEDRRTGLLVTPESVKELAEAMTYLLANPSTAARMAAHHKERVRRFFSWSRAVDRYLALLHRNPDGGSGTTIAPVDRV